MACLSSARRIAVSPALSRSLKFMRVRLALMFLFALTGCKLWSGTSLLRSNTAKTQASPAPTAESKSGGCALAPADESMVTSGFAGELRAGCEEVHSALMAIRPVRIGKVKVHPRRAATGAQPGQNDKSDYPEFLSNHETQDLQDQMRDAVENVGGQADTPLKFVGCRITPALGDVNTLTGEVGTGSNNPKDCTAWLEKDWGTGPLGDTRQFEFVVSRGPQGTLHQWIRVTGSWNELSAIFMVQPPLSEPAMLHYRPDSWKKELAFLAPFSTRKPFNEEEVTIATKMLGLKSELPPKTLEDFSKVWLARQIQGGRTNAAFVSAQILLTTLSAGQMGVAWGSLSAASKNLAVAVSTQAGKRAAAQAFATSLFQFSVLSGGVVAAVGIPLHRQISDLENGPFKASLQFAYFLSQVSAVYNVFAIAKQSALFTQSSKLLFRKEALTLLRNPKSIYNAGFVQVNDAVKAKELLSINKHMVEFEGAMRAFETSKLSAGFAKEIVTLKADRIQLLEDIFRRMALPIVTQQLVRVGILARDASETQLFIEKH